MWRKRRRYMFRKKSSPSRFLWPLIVILVVSGIIWFIPWPTLNLVAVADAPKVEISKDQVEQAFTKDPPELVATNDQAKQQEFTEDQPKDEEGSEDTPSPPPKEEGSSNKLVSPSPLPAQPPLPSPPSLSPPRVEEIPEIYLPSNDYWYDDPSYSYYEPDSWYYESDYWYY